MKKLSKKQLRQERMKSPNREKRVLEVRRMLSGSPKEFLVQIHSKAFNICLLGSVNDLKSMGITFTENEILNIRKLDMAMQQAKKAEKEAIARSKEELLPRNFFDELGWEWEPIYDYIDSITPPREKEELGQERSYHPEEDDLPF